MGLLAALLGSAAGATAARAEPGASPWATTNESAARLVSAVTAVGQGAVGQDSALPIGLEIRLEPGWKTYWRSPGDAGLPVAVDWAGSSNLARAEIEWPVPHRFSLFGLDTFGYSEHVVLPIVATPARAGEAVSLRAHVSYLVCATICVPVDADLALDLGPGPAEPTAHVQLIDRFRVQVPDDGTRHGLWLEGAALIGDGEDVEIEAVVRSAVPFQSPDLIVEGPPGLVAAAPTVQRGPVGNVAVLRVRVSMATGEALPASLPVTLTLVDGARGLERSLTLERAAGASAATVSLATMLALALLGGLILNLMPCVLPVLSLKLMSAIGHGGAQGRAVRLSFLASAAGVVASFLVLAAALAGLKAVGVAVGWGIQFQQPVFLIAMVLLLTLFAASLWDWYQVRLPSWLGDAALAATDDRHGARSHGLGGAFATGALATLLATPCSAPFVGTALGFALARGTGEILAVMAAMGVGLALPYLAVAAWPRLVTWLPRPGRWMVNLRRLLGLALVGTAVWLLAVLLTLISAPAVAAGAALAATMAGLIWLRTRLPARLRLTAAVLAAASAVGALLLPLTFPGGPSLVLGPVTEGAVAWQPFDRARLATLVSQGKTVFVDVTAEWCVTCQVNKLLVLDNAEVAARLNAPGVVAMLADWTQPSDEISRYLASFGRYGIPFNAVYGPKAPTGIALPELLGVATVLEALATASD